MRLFRWWTQLLLAAWIAAFMIASWLSDQLLLLILAWRANIQLKKRMKTIDYWEQREGNKE